MQKTTIPKSEAQKVDYKIYKLNHLHSLGLNLIETLAKIKTLQWPVFGGGITLYIIGLFVSWFVAGGKFERVLALTIAAVIFWCLWFICGTGGRHRLLYYSGLVTVAVLAVVGVVALAQLDDDYLRLNSVSQKVITLIKQFVPPLDWLVMHRNALAGMLAIFGTLATVYLVFALHWWVRLVSGLAFLLMLAALLVTNSRGGLAAFGVGLVLLGLICWQSIKVKARPLFIATGSGVAVVALGYLVVSGQYRLFSPERLVNENGANRLEIWRNVFYMLADTPLTGIGAGHFQSFYPFYLDPTRLVAANSQEHAHNLFLQSYIELGLFAWLGIVWVTSLWLIILWKILRSKITADAFVNDTVRVRFTNLRAGVASFGALLAYGVAEHSTWNSQFAILFWLPVALMACSIYPFSFKPNFIIQPLARLWHWVVSGSPSKKLAATALAVTLSMFFIWQFDGLFEINRASLEKLTYWQNQQGDLNHVMTLYEDAAATVSWSNAPVGGMAWVAMQRKAAPEAEKFLRQSLSRDPNDTRSSLLLADLLANQGKLDEAIQFWRKANAAPTYLWRGRSLLDTTDDTQAEPYLLRAIQIEPTIWDSYSFLVMLYQRHGRTADSIALLEQAKVYFPNDVRLISELERLRKA